ncbi:unnamed protein product [Closterium sp. NIES-54]
MLYKVYNDFLVVGLNNESYTLMFVNARTSPNGNVFFSEWYARCCRRAARATGPAAGGASGAGAAGGAAGAAAAGGTSGAAGGAAGAGAAGAAGAYQGRVQDRAVAGGMASRTLVSGLPRSLPPLPPRPAPTCVPCVEGRQRAAPHYSEFPPIEAPLQTLHMDVWGPARVRGQGHERHFLLVVDDYSRYTTVFPLRRKGEVTEVLIDWIRGARRQLSESFGSDLPVLRLHSDRGAPHWHVMDVTHTSMIHAAAPHFLWPFAVQYAAHQINLQPRVSLLETTPTLRWTGRVGDAYVFRVWGSRAFVRDAFADKLSSRAVLCVFLGFPPDAPGWQFYHPTSRHVLSSQDVTFDESVSYYRLFPYRTAPLPPPPLFLAPGAPPVDPLPPQGPAISGVYQVDPVEPVEVADDSDATRGAEPAGAEPGGAEPGVTESEGAERGGAEPKRVEPWGAEPAGAESGGAEPWGAEPERAESGGPPGVPSRWEPLYPQPLREWYARRCRCAAGATGPAAGGASGAGAAGGAADAAAAGGTSRAAGGAAGAGAAGAAGHGGAGAGGTGTVGGARTGGTGAAGAGGAAGVGARLLATVVTDPSFESNAASALVAELVDFAAHCRLDYAASLVAESESVSVCPLIIGGESALGTDVLEERQEEFQCFAPAVPHLVSMLLAPEGDPDPPNIPTPRSYAEAIEGPYSSQWQAAMDVEMASRKSTGTYVVVGVDFFHTFSPTPKMTTLQVLLHVAAQRDYELHSLDFSIAFLQGSLHKEIWLRRPPGFTGSFPPGTHWSLRRPVYGIRQAPREWHDTLRTTLAALGFFPSTADPSLFLHCDATLPPFYVLVYVDDLVFATADTEAPAHLKSEIAQCTITLTQSHMVQQVLQRFGFTYSSPQSTPLPTGHSLSAPPSDESVQPSGPYPKLVGCLMYLMTCTRPDLSYPLSLLACYVAPGRHRKVHWDAAKRVLRYLWSTSGMGLVLGGRARVVLTGHADASWVDDLATQRSS